MLYLRTGRAMTASVSLLALVSPISVRAQEQATTAATPVTGSTTQTDTPQADSTTPTADAGDIIVTAQKRSERLQDVPISITALSSQTLVARNINTLQDLPRAVPTLKGGFAPGVSSVRLGIRGLGSAGNSAIEPSVATFVDGVYIPRAGSVYGSLVDLASIEVLSGPQGTLFGRNASVGAINIRTGEPGRDFAGRVAVEAGTGDRYRADGFVNLPIGSESALRISGLAQLFNGYWNFPGKVQSGVDDYAGRVAFKTKLTNSLTWIIRGDISLTTGGNVAYQPLLRRSLTSATEAAYIAKLGSLPSTDLNSNDSNEYANNYGVKTTHRGVSSDLAFDFADGFTLRMINSYRLWRDTESDGDAAGLPIPVIGRDIFWRSQSHSNEIQITSPSNRLLDGRLNFVAGLYEFGESLTQDYKFNLLDRFCDVIIPPPGQAACLANPRTNAASYALDQKTESLAAYVQGGLKIVDKLELTLGLRYSHDDKDGVFVGTLRNPVAASLETNENTNLKFDAGRFTYRANIAYRPTAGLMLFATYSTGFKSGGFNSGNSPVVLGQQRVFRPETVKNYEAGFKFESDDRILTLNATAFRMDVDDFQERAQNGLTAVVRNVGSVRQQGFEADASVRPSTRFRANASIAYLNSKFLSYPNAPGIPGISATQDLTGAPLTYSPKVSGNVGGEYTVPLAGGSHIAFRSDFTFTSKFAAGNSIDNNPLAYQPAYGLLSARLTYFSPDNRWSLAAFADNITDKRYCASIGNQVLDAPLGARNATTGTALRCFLAAPRTIGARAEIKF